MLLHCHLDSIASDEKLEVTGIVVPLYVMRRFFLGDFQDFLFIFGQQVDYDRPKCGYM